VSTSVSGPKSLFFLRTNSYCIKAHSIDLMLTQSYPKTQFPQVLGVWGF
jgi:hypothetical protein